METEEWIFLLRPNIAMENRTQGMYGVSHSVVVSALRCGWVNTSSSPPFEFELGDKCCCNLSNYNHAT